MAIRESKTILTAEDRTGGAFASMQKNLQTTMGQFERWQGMFAGLAGGAGIGAFGIIIKNALDTGEALNKMSQKTGIAVEQLSELSYAAKLADVSNETLGKGIKALSESMIAASDPTSKQAKLFKELGVNIKGDTLSALEQLAKQYAILPDGATKAALSTELFKKAGQDLIPFLNMGADGIAKLRAEAQALGLTMTSETAKAAEQFNDNLKTLQMSTGNLGISLVNDLAPGLVKASDAMKEALIESGKLKAAWVGLGAVGAFLFTDDMLSTSQKLNKDIREMSEKIELLKAARAEEGGILDWLFNSDAKLDARLAAANAELAKMRGLLADMNKPPAQAGADAKAAADAEGKAKANAITKLLADQKAAADENAKHNERLRQLDIKGWVAYADQVFAEADELNKSLAEVADAYWKGEEKAKETDIKGWVAYIEAMEKEYEEGLKAIGDKQPSFFQAQQKEWEGYLGRIESGFSDIWTKLIDRSLSSWKQFTTSLRDMFKRTVSDFIYQAFAKPIVLQLVAGVAGGLGMSGLASAATGAAGAASGASSLLGLGSLGSMLGNFGSGATFGSSVGLGGTFANLGAGGGSLGFQAGSVAGAAGPYVLAALAAYQAYNAFRDKGENPKYRLGFGSAAQGYASDSIFGMQGFQYAQGNDAANQGFRNFQLGLGGLDTQIGGLMTPAQIAAAAGRLNGVTGREFSFPKGDPTASEQLSKEFLQIKYEAVFRDLDATFADYVAGFAGQSEDLIKQIGNMATVLGVLSEGTIKNLTIEALRAFQKDGEELIGTLKRVGDAYMNYERLFVPASETAAAATDKLRETLAGLGGSLPATREAYRALVDAQDLTTASGRALWEALLNGATVADAYYNTLVDGVQKQNKVVELGIRLMELEGNATGALAAQRAIELAALDASLRPLMELIYAQEDLNATNAAAAALATTNTNLQIRLLELEGNSAGALAARRAIELNGVDESTAAILRLIHAREDEISATQRLSDAATAAAEKIAEALDNLKNIAAFQGSNNATIAGIMQGRAGYNYGAYLQGNVNTARSGYINSLSGSVSDRIAGAGSLRDALGAQYQYNLDRLQQAQQQQLDGMRTQIAAQRTLASQAQQLGETFKSLGQYGRSLLVGSFSPLSPEAQLAASASEYQSLLARARGGDRNAASGLQSASQSYLQQAQGFYGSAGAYAAIFQQVQGDLVGFESMGDQQLALAQALNGYADSMESSLATLTNALTPEMIDLQDRYIRELELLNTDAEAWANEQRAIAESNTLVYRSIADSSTQVAANTAGLRADVRELIGVMRTSTTAPRPVTPEPIVINGVIRGFTKAAEAMSDTVVLGQARQKVVASNA